MVKRVFTWLLLTPLLFNGVWASVHVNEKKHHSHHAPHIHLKPHHHKVSDQLFTNAFSLTKVSDFNLANAINDASSDESGDHDSHEHIHIYLSVYIKTDELNQFEKRDTANLFGFNSQFISLIPSPPVPPPNI
jgi:hypothetical protein